MELLYGLSLSLCLSVSLWRTHLLWYSAQKLDSLSYLSPSENTSVSRLVWFFAQKLGFLSQRTHLHIILAILHRNWALSLREHIFFTSSMAILHRIQITNTLQFHSLSFLTASETEFISLVMVFGVCCGSRCDVGEFFVLIFFWELILSVACGWQAYVTQADDLIGTLTVNETIYYSASLRLSSKIPRAEKKAIVESTIREMGLMECRNTPVGNWHLRGLSGGERRRLSIALEILTRPRLLFLDEPTSGLDR